MRKQVPALLILFGFLLAAGYCYQFPYLWHLPPQGSHIWRQADCLAMTQQYHYFQLPFLQPATWNLESVDGKVAGEFPIFYFLAAKADHYSFVLRLLHSLCLFAGVVAVYFIASYFLGRRLLSIFCSMLFFTSPLLIFYGNNFLSDVPALCFALMGWAFFLYGQKGEKLLLLPAFLCLTLSALLKASEAMHLAIVFFFIARTLRPEPERNYMLLLPILSGILVMSWYLFAKAYNLDHHDTYYFLSYFPIWKLSLHDIGLGVWRMTVSWSRNYFWRPSSVVLLLFSIYGWKQRRHIPPELRFLVALSFLFTMLYIVLFYQRMLRHEYYYTAFYGFIVFALIALFKVYNAFHSENVFAHAALFLCLLLNVYYCGSFVSEKLSDDYYNASLSSAGMQEFLDARGVRLSSTVLSLPDESPNRTLSQIRRKGYTAFNDYASVLRSGKAAYLVAADPALLNDTLIRPHLSDSLGAYRGVLLYRLK